MYRNHLTARLLLAMGLGATLTAACGGNEDGTASGATAGSGGAGGPNAGSGGSTSGAGGSAGGSGGTTAAGSGGSTSGAGGSAGSLGGTSGNTAGTGGAGAGGAGTGGAGAGGSCTTSCSESVLCYAPDGSRATTDPKGGPTSCAAAVHDVGGTCPSIPLQQTECFPLGTCGQPSAIAVTTPVGDACCYKMKVCVNSCCGRPIFVDGSARVAALVRGDHWASAPSWV